MRLETLLSKQGRIVLALGRDLMGRQVGERIPTVQEYAERCQTSVGTIQNAQAYLQQEAMIRLQSRGHQGTYLLDINRRSLWQLVHPGDLIGAMPLPYSTRYEGLATGLNEALEGAGISLNLVFMRGSNVRLRALTEGRCDFAIMSAFAVDDARRHDEPITTILNLGRESYVSEHVLVFRQPGYARIADGMRVGIDPQSVDQAHLTRQACVGHAVTLVEISYMQLPAALQRGMIDATVWNRDELRRYTDLYLAPNGAVETTTNTEACIVTLSDAAHLKALLDECLNADDIRRTQDDVMRGDRLPRF